MDWSDDMKAAAMKDAQRVCDLDAAARFLVVRLREYESECQCEAGHTEWNGHVEPALCRLEKLLAESPPREN